MRCPCFQAFVVQSVSRDLLITQLHGNYAYVGYLSPSEWGRQPSPGLAKEGIVGNVVVQGVFGEDGACA